MSTTDLLPLERVQIDHTQVDVIVVDEGDRLPIGRPWLTLAVDVASRVVLGFSISLEGPSAVSVAYEQRRLAEIVHDQIDPPAKKALKRLLDDTQGLHEITLLI